MGYLVIVGGVALPFAAAICWRLASQFDPLNDALDDPAYGDVIRIPTDAQLLDNLRGVKGGCSEVGAPVHVERNSREAR